MNSAVNNSISGNEPVSRLQSLYIGNIDPILPACKIKPRIVINPDNIKVTTSTGDVPVNKKIEFNDEYGKKENSNKTEKIYKTINNTKTIISISGQIAKITNQEGFSEILSSTEGALSASEGMVELKNADSEENNSKVVMSSISQVANGVGSVLNAANIPEAEFIMLTGKLAGLGAERQNLSEQINKKDARGIIGTTVALSKGAWGTVVSGVNAAKLSANLGLKLEIVSTATVGKISATAAKISKVADKIAIPFALAGTGLSLWDWNKSSEKVNEKKRELLAIRLESMINPSKNYSGKGPVSGVIITNLKSSTEKLKEKEIIKEIETLKTNSQIMGCSFGVSAISTTALIASVAFPETAYISEPITLGSSIASSIIGTLADDKTRASIKGTYEKVKLKYDTFIFKIDKLLSNQATI